MKRPKLLKLLFFTLGGLIILYISRRTYSMYVGKQQSAQSLLVRIEQDDLENSLRYLENYKLSDVSINLRKMGVELQGFYHVSTWQPFWKAVIYEQLQIMDGKRQRKGLSEFDEDGSIWTSILALSTKLYLNVAGSHVDFDNVQSFIKKISLRWTHKIEFDLHSTVQRNQYRFSSNIEKHKLRQRSQNNSISEGEYSTIVALHKYCKETVMAGKQSYVYYLHSKGSCCPKGPNNPVADWRDEMNSFIIEFPSICLRALLEGYKTCGVEYQDSHYSGNFWWADCAHIAALPELWDPINNAYECEYFLFNVSLITSLRENYARNCGYNPFHCHVNHYDTVCPRSKYIKRILELVSQEVLPANPTATLGKDVNWVKDRCREAHDLSYSEQSSWSRPGAASWNIR